MGKERRGSKRVPIKVLVKCLPSGKPFVRNGHETKRWDLWARDIADDGVGLIWSKGWASQNCPHWFDWLSDTQGRTRCECTHPPKGFQKGQKVLLDGLIYTEKGPKVIKGRIQWIRGRKENSLHLGIYITSPGHRSYFKALEH